MKRIKVRLATPEDIPAFAEYMHGSQGINLFDPEFMSYPLTKVLCAYDDSGPLLFMPCGPVMSMDALAPKPGLTARQEALALREITHAIVALTEHAQMREAWFLCSDERVVKFAAAHGYEEMPVKVLRLKTRNLEGRKNAVEETS